MIELIVIAISVSIAFIVVFYGNKNGGWADTPSYPITPTPKETARDPRRQKQQKPQKAQKADKRRNTPQ